MADWNNPQTGQTYTNHFESIRDKDSALAKMFDGTSETNLPDGAIKINSGSKYRIEKWDASASSWNTVIPGLGDLTQAEVDQLANIGSTTISGTQWGYLGGLGSAPLEDDDLAANGGTVPAIDRENVFATTQRIETTRVAIKLYESDGSIDQRLFYLFNENSRLQIKGRNDDGSVVGPQELDILHSNAGGGVAVGAPSGAHQGIGTLNAEKLYDNGNRVYSASNAPESTDLSDGTALLAPGSSSDPGLTLGSWRTPNASRATFVTVNYSLDNPGSFGVSGALQVDESGGTNSDYSVTFRSDNAGDEASVSAVIPPGGSYRVTELSGEVTIDGTREWTL